MLKELLGKRPEDFDEPAIRASPTFAKWIDLPQRGKLRYANRSYVKGKGDDEEKLMRRIMVALKQQAKLSQQEAAREQEVEKGKDESEEILQIQKQSFSKTAETKHRTSTSTETTASTSTTPESEDDDDDDNDDNDDNDDDDDDVDRATDPVAAVVAEAGTRVPDPVIVAAEGEGTTDPPEALVRTASTGSDSVVQDWFAVQCPAELNDACRLRSLCTSGPRSQLIMRLAEHDAAVAELEAAKAMKAARAKAAAAARAKAAVMIATASLAAEEAEAAAAEARAEAARAAKQADDEAKAARVAAEQAAAKAVERAAAEAEAAAARELAEAAVAVAGTHEKKAFVHQAEKHPVGTTAAAAWAATVAATAAPVTTKRPCHNALPDSITTSQTTESLSVVSSLSMHSTTGGDKNNSGKKIQKENSNKKKKQQHEETTRTYCHPDRLSLSKHCSQKHHHKTGSSDAPADAAGELSSSRHNKTKKQPTSAGELSSSRHNRRSVLLMGKDGGGRDARVRMKKKAAEIIC